MLEPMTVRVEVWPVAADETGLWLVSGDDALRSAAVPADSEPHAEVEITLARSGLMDHVTLLHSTSWRVDGPAILLTYVAVVATDDFVRGIWPGARPITVDLADAVGKPPTHAASEPPTPRYIDTSTCSCTACGICGSFWIPTQRTRQRWVRYGGGISPPWSPRLPGCTTSSIRAWVRTGQIAAGQRERSGCRGYAARPTTKRLGLAHAFAVTAILRMAHASIGL